MGATDLSMAPASTLMKRGRNSTMPVTMNAENRVPVAVMPTSAQPMTSAAQAVKYRNWSGT